MNSLDIFSMATQLLLTVMAFLVGWIVGQRRARASGIPDYQNPPPPPPRGAVRWYPVTADEVVVGEIYRDRLSFCRVRITRTGKRDETGKLVITAAGVLWNHVTGEKEDYSANSDMLETDQLRLSSHGRNELARLERAAITGPLN